jgi:hypothetical protein
MLCQELQTDTLSEWGAQKLFTNPLSASGTSKGEYVLCSICGAVRRALLLQEKDQHRNGNVLEIWSYKIKMKAFDHWYHSLNNAL